MRAGRKKPGKAVDACTAAGGGKVYLAGGTFLSGTVFLKSNVTLQIESGAVLLGSPRRADYPSILPEHKSYCDTRHDKSILYAEKATNVSIIGGGIIDGNAVAIGIVFVVVVAGVLTVVILNRRTV